MYKVVGYFETECESAPFGAAWLEDTVAKCVVVPQKAGAQCPG